GAGGLAAALLAVAVAWATRPDRPGESRPIPDSQPDPNGWANRDPDAKPPVDPAASAKLTLTAGGSTFVAPIMSYWTDLYGQKTGTHVAYKGVGSGKGIEGVKDGSFVFGCTDAPMKDEEIKKLREGGREVLHVPLVMGAVVPTYNLPGVTRRLRFTGGLLADIYLGKVTRWNDPVIQANNPGVELPDRKIQVVYRSDASGTTFIWTDYLTKVSGEWAEKKIGPATRVTWPDGVGTGAEKSDGLAAAVTRTVGAIGYVELSHAIANSLPFGEVRNKMGNYVVPSLESVTAAAAGTIPAVQAEEFRLPLTDAPGETSYPISGMTWAVLVFPAREKPRPEAVEFLEWATHDGQEYAPGLRFAPLPENLRVRLDATFYRLKRKS
ncbi:MAG: phosphate transporter substrate-binding protein PhoT family, partial [Gemmataceae bacterium]|nr:phosphate transporter substrate-binding protein PhoT family [Gemmataceae bacterium]